jgi:hypothetical protein
MKKINQKGYTHYLYSSNIHEGFYFKSDALERLKELLVESPEYKGLIKVYSKIFLLSKKVNPDINSNWSSNIF